MGGGDHHDAGRRHGRERAKPPLVAHVAIPGPRSDAAAT
jgi:hypothetical protein